MNINRLCIFAALGVTLSGCGAYYEDGDDGSFDELETVSEAEQAVASDVGLYANPLETGEWGFFHEIGSEFGSHGTWAPGTAGGCSYDYNLALAQCREEWMCTNGAYYCVDVRVRSPRCDSMDGSVDIECCGYQWCQICKCKGDDVSDPSLPSP